LLDKDLGTDSETQTVAMQERGNHSCITIELLLETVLMQPVARQLQKLDNNNGNGGVLYVGRAEEFNLKTNEVI
jgi:hypothetical protein